MFTGYDDVPNIMPNDDGDNQLQPEDFLNNIYASNKALSSSNQDNKDKNKTIETTNVSKESKKRGREGKKGNPKIHDKYKDDNIIKGCISFLLRIIHSFFCAQLDEEKKIEAISSQIQQTSKKAYLKLLNKQLRDLLSAHKYQKTDKNKNKSIIDSLASNEKYKDFLDMTFEDFLEAISPSIRLEPENSSFSTRATTGNKDNGIELDEEKKDKNKDNGIELDEEKEDNIIESIKNGLSKELTVIFLLIKFPNKFNA